MEKSKKRRSTHKQKEVDYPGWLWMLFGLAIGLSVAFAIHIKDREPHAEVAVAAREPASMQNSLDNNAETKVVEKDVAEPKEKRFSFYDMLPAFEIVVETEKPAVDKDVEPQAIEEAGVYLLQAGSFSTHNDADRRRAELALHGIESRVQRARVNSRDFYRVYIGTIDDLDELNITRSRLRAAKIDVMRIRLGD
jgi:cell division protein FtsN